MKRRNNYVRNMCIQEKLVFPAELVYNHGWDAAEIFLIPQF